MTTATPPQEGNCWKRDRNRNRLDGFFVPFTTGLFDGNIAAITYKNGYLTNTNDYYTNNTIGDIYRYDKLGRLREDLFLVNNTGTSFTRNIGTKQNMYDSRYIYDPNSNIKHLSRRSLYDNAGSVQSTQIDSLTYNYPSSTSNRLGHVTDIIPTATPGVNDLPTQAPNRYEYDNSGNLIRDNENNVEYSWNAQGKVYEIRRISGTDQFTIRFDYDAQGNKVRKQVFIGTNTTPSSTTYYVYDATGTLMAVYKKEGSNSVYLCEAPINAPGRIGMWRFGATEKLHSNNSINDNVRIYDRYINKKLYELTDQTGNVRAVVGDSKTWSGNETVPHVPMSGNYYPYGMAQAGRVASTGADYRYGYNGMEEEDRGDQVSAEIASTGEKPKPGEGNLLNTEYRLYDPRLAQWLTRDPVFQPWESPYSAMGGNPILFNDPLGLATNDPNKDANVAKPTEAGQHIDYEGGHFMSVENSKGELHWAVSTKEIVVTAQRTNPPATTNKSFHVLPLPLKTVPTTRVSPRGGMWGLIISFVEYVIRDLAENGKPLTTEQIRETQRVNPFIPPSNGLDIPTTTTGTDTPPGFEPESGHKPDRQPVIAPPPYDIVDNDDDDDRNEITLYRGVYFGHPDYHNALKGEAHPMNLNSTTTAEQHNLGDNNSMFTSWTRRRSVAVGFANQVRRPGVVLVKKFKIGEIVPSPDVFEEEEVLVPGIVRGAIVTPP